MKTLVIEPRDGAELQAAIATYTTAVKASERRGSGGAILLAVCRGKLSEGVDFADSACRGVVITGLPLPPTFDAKVELKRSFLDERRRLAAARGGNALTRGMLSGEEWYQQQAMRAINQAVGRVIRHIDDYGVILLCEARFSSRKWVDGLSGWLRPYVKQFSSFGQGYQPLQRFFRLRADEATAAAAQASEQGFPGGAEAHGGGDIAEPPAPPPPARPRPEMPPPAPPPSLLSALGGGRGASAPPPTSTGAPPSMAMAMAGGAAATSGDASTSAVAGLAPTAEADRSARVQSLFPAAADAVTTPVTGGAQFSSRPLSDSESSLAARPRKEWAPREQLRPLASGSSSSSVAGIVVGGASGVADSPADPPPAQAGASSAARDSNGRTGHDPPQPATAAVALQRLAKATLPKEAYRSFMALVQEVKALDAASRSTPVPVWLVDRAVSFFSEPGRADVLGLFLNLEVIRQPPHLQRLRAELARVHSQPKQKPAAALAATASAQVAPAPAVAGRPPAPPMPQGSSSKRLYGEIVARLGAKDAAATGNGRAPLGSVPSPGALAPGAAVGRPPQTTAVGGEAPAPPSGLARGNSGGSGRGGHGGSHSGECSASSGAVDQGGGGHGSSRSREGASSERAQGEAFMHKVKAHFAQHGTSSHTYPVFKDALRTALRMLKQASSTAPAETTEDVAARRTRGMEALHTIAQLLAPPGLNELGDQLPALLPAPFADEWRGVLAHTRARSSTADGTSACHAHFR